MGDRVHKNQIAQNSMPHTMVIQYFQALMTKSRFNPQSHRVQNSSQSPHAYTSHQGACVAYKGNTCVKRHSKDINATMALKIRGGGSRSHRIRHSPYPYGSGNFQFNHFSQKGVLNDLANPRRGEPSYLHRDASSPSPSESAPATIFKKGR